jgi:hypothetical protein
MNRSAARRVFMRDILLAVAAGAALIALPFAVSSQTPVASPGAVRTSSHDGVTVKVTLKPAPAGEWLFAVVLDTHSQELSDDLMSAAVLVAGDAVIRPVAWSGTASGGHHREGTLKFAAQPVTALELRIQRPNEAAPRIFRWDAAALR